MSHVTCTKHSCQTRQNTCLNTPPFQPLVTAGKDTTNVPRTPIAASREQHEEYEENDEEGKEEEEREKGRERERIREQRAEMEGQQKQNNERESEAEREKQIQRNLLAAAGMSL